MWVNCNLVKFNLEAMLLGQRLSIRQAGLCSCAGWQAGSAGAYITVIAYLSSPLLFLLIFADHGFSQPVISAGVNAPTPPIPWID